MCSSPAGHYPKKTYATQRNSDLVISTRKCMEFYFGDLDWTFYDIRKSMEHPSFSCKIGTSSSHIFPLQLLLFECEPWSCYGVEARKHQDFSGPSCSDLCLPDRVDMGANRPKWFLFAGDQGEKMWKGYGWWRKGSGFMVDFPYPTVRKSWVDGKWWKWIWINGKGGSVPRLDQLCVGWVGLWTVLFAMW